MPPARAVFLGLGLFLLVVVPGSAAAGPSAPGLAMVTTLRGSVTFGGATERLEAVDLHTVLELEELTIETGPDATLFLSLSNGMGIGLQGHARLRVLRYRQEPFSPQEASLRYEPSVSELRMKLDFGMVALANPHLSPLSTAKLRLPFGQLQLHSAVCEIEANPAGVDLRAHRGSLTYTFPDAATRAFIAAPETIRLTEAAAAIGRVAERVESDTIETKLAPFPAAALHASERVLFRTGPDGTPEPILVAPMEYFDRPPVQHYSYPD